MKTTIDAACELVTDGTHYTPKDVGKGVPFLTVKDVSNRGLDFKECSHITEDDFALAKQANCAPQLGDVLFSKDGTVGKVHVVHENREFAVLSSIAILRPNLKITNPKYLGHALRGSGVLRDATKKKTGSAIRRIILSDLKSVPFWLPSLPDQRRIADILDRADALRAKRRTALARLDELTHAIFVEMFGDPTKQSWPMAKIANIVDDSRGGIRTGPFGSQLLHSEFADSGIAVLGIDNAVTNEFRWGERRFITTRKYADLRRYTVYPGDVLITIMGTCGRCAVVPDDIPIAINTKHLCCITTDREKCLPDYLHAYFLEHPIARDYLSRTAKGAIMDGLNMGLIKDMPIPLAPIALQQSFVSRLAGIRQQRDRMRTWQAHCEELFSSLQSRAFSEGL